MTAKPSEAVTMACHGWIFGVVLCVSLWAEAVLPVEAGELRVNVEGLRNSDGLVRLALYNLPESFPVSDKAYTFSNVPIPDKGLSVLFPDLPPGEYALAFFHDENNNNIFDKGFLGLPLEGFGFSNDAPVFFSAPSFAATAVTVGEGLTTIIVHVRYWSLESPPEAEEK